MILTSHYPLSAKDEQDIKGLSPIPARKPTAGFNAKADTANPTNTPTMNEYGQLSHPWQKEAPGFVEGTNKIKKAESSFFKTADIVFGGSNNSKKQKNQLIYGMF